MFEFSRPDPKAAFTWIAVWLFALVALALVPMDKSKADFAALQNQSHFSQDINFGSQDVTTPARHIRG